MSKILITGGTGFIGSRLAKTLSAKDFQVTVLARNKKSDINSSNIEFIQADIQDKEKVDSAIEGKDIVFHLAAVTDEQLPFKVLYDINVNGTRNVLEACIKQNPKCLIFTSTTGVLGPTGERPAQETDPYNPQTNYEKSKCEAERLVLEYHKKFNLPVVILRPTMIYGPDERWLKVFKQAQKGIPIIGEGKNHWHLVYVDDVVEALELAMLKEAGRGETFHIADNQAYPYRQVYRIMRKVLGLEEVTKHIPIWLANSFALFNEVSGKLQGKRPILIRAHIERLIRERSLDISKAKTQLGYNPKYDLETGFQKTFKRFQEEGLL